MVLLDKRWAPGRLMVRLTETSEDRDRIRIRVRVQGWVRVSRVGLT